MHDNHEHIVPPQSWEVEPDAYLGYDARRSYWLLGENIFAVSEDGFATRFHCTLAAWPLSIKVNRITTV